jgi:hypothetical protein
MNWPACNPARICVKAGLPTAALRLRPMEQITLVWSSLSTVIIGGLLTFAAGFLIGLGFGLRGRKAGKPAPPGIAPNN